MSKHKDNLTTVPDKKIGISIEDCLPRIEKLVNFYGRKFNSEILGTPIEDMYQESVYQLLHTKYLERYDYTRPIHVYLSGFIYNLFCHTFNRGMSSVSRAESIERGSSATSFSILSRVGVSDSSMDDSQELDNIMSILEAKFKPNMYTVFNSRLQFICVSEDISSFDKDFIVVPNSPSIIFKLLYQGLSTIEIKHTLRMPPPNYTRVLKQLSEVKEIRNWAYSKGYILGE